jgi:propanediol dehydratase small subunit
MTDNTTKTSFRYPLGEHHRNQITTKSGRSLENLNIEQILSGDVDPGDVSISAETLDKQAEFAREAGYDEVAANLARAAEMTRIPNGELMDIYESLRPGRCTYYQLLSLSQQVSSMYDAELTGAYIREAADVYRDTGMLKMD